MRDIQKYMDDYCRMEDPANRFENEYQVYYRRKKVLEELNRYPHNTILEIGCGMDSYAKYVDEFKEFVIVEPGEKFAEKASEDCGGDLRISVIQDIFQNVAEKLSEKKFDFIIISALLHELEQPVDFLKLVNSMCLKNHTVVHVNVPNAESFHRVLAMESGMIELTMQSERNKLLQQHTVFHMEQLKRTVLESVGNGKAEVLDSGSYFMKPFSHRQMMQCLEQGIITEQVIAGLDKMIKYFPQYGSEIFVNYRLR